MLYGYLIVALERAREGPDPIEIVVDRRRAGTGVPAVERRRPSDADREIQRRGFVVLDENGAIVRALEPPAAERRPAWKAQALRARHRIETAWRSLPALPSLTRARDGLEAARQQSLSTVTRAREGLHSRWQAVSAMAQAATPRPAPSSGATGASGGRSRLPGRAGTLWMLGGAVAAVAAAAAFVALEPPDPPDPAAAQASRASSGVSTAAVTAVHGPGTEPSVASDSPPPASDPPAPAVVTTPPTAAPDAAGETPASAVATSRPVSAPDRAGDVTREAPAAIQPAAAARETPAAARPAAPRDTPASPQTAAVREIPAPRQVAAARSEETPDARPGGPPRVELQSDAAGRADERTITYTARLSDARGRPLVNAEVSLHGWLPDGTDLKARLASTSTPGVYRASVPVGPRTPSNLRVLVAHGGKRFEVAPQRRAL